MEDFLFHSLKHNYHLRIDWEDILRHPIMGVAQLKQIKQENGLLNILKKSMIPIVLFSFIFMIIAGIGLLLLKSEYMPGLEFLLKLFSLGKFITGFAG